MEYKQADFEQLETRFRANFFNTLNGFKSANLIGSINHASKTNLAVFNSVIHLGANPPLIGFVLRPTTVARHTYANILETKYYTINHIHTGMIEKAHQTSAKYDVDISEFDAVGFEPVYKNDFKAPYVNESIVQIGLNYKSDYLIKENGTRMIVGEVIEVHLPDTILNNDGSISLTEANTVTISGLDTYLSCKEIKKLSYARP